MNIYEALDFGVYDTDETAHPDATVIVPVSPRGMLCWQMLGYGQRIFCAN